MLRGMPEGHTIHRLARLHRAALTGTTVAVSSPQGRFAEGAAVLDGRRLDTIDAIGKHLFYRFSDAPALHIHLGLFGKFRTVRGVDAAPPGEQTRLVLAGRQPRDDTPVRLQLSGPTACELCDPAAEAAIRARLGPDPLDPRCEASAFLATLARRRAAIGQVLLDQRAIAGVGNVYRAEALFLEGVHPDTPVTALSARTCTSLWQRLVTLLTAGARSGRIVTVAPADRPGGGRVRREDAHYVYRRAGLPCRRCAEAIRAWPLGGRPVYACTGCQPPP